MDQTRRTDTPEEPSLMAMMPTNGTAPGVTLTASGWTFVAVSGISLASVAAAGSLLLRSASGVPAPRSGSMVSLSGPGGTTVAAAAALPPVDIPTRPAKPRAAHSVPIPPLVVTPAPTTINKPARMASPRARTSVALPASLPALGSTEGIAPVANADDAADMIALSAAVGGADALAVHTVAEAKPKLPALRPQVSLPRPASSPLAAARVSARIVARKARVAKTTPDVVVTGLVLSEDGGGQNVAVIRENGGSGSRRFVTVGDVVEGEYVVSAIRAGGITVHKRQTPAKTYTVAAWSPAVAQRERGRQAQLLPTSEDVPGEHTSEPSPARIAAAPPAVPLPAKASSALPEEKAPVIAAAAPAAPTPHTPLPPPMPVSETAAPEPISTSSLRFAMSATAANTAIAARTGVAATPKLTWQLMLPSGAEFDNDSLTGPVVIDYRVLLFEMDGTAEGKIVAASPPLSETSWIPEIHGQPLEANKIYRWQVYARFSDGTLSVSPTTYMLSGR